MLCLSFLLPFFISQASQRLFTRSFALAISRGAVGLMGGPVMYRGRQSRCVGGMAGHEPVTAASQGA